MTARFVVNRSMVSVNYLICVVLAGLLRKFARYHAMPVPARTFSQAVFPLSVQEVARCRQLAQQLGSVGDAVEKTFVDANHRGYVPRGAVFPLIVCVSILSFMSYSLSALQF